MVAGSISVVIPNLDMAHLLADAVGSLMRQDHPVGEIIVADCESTDGTEAMVARLASEGAPIRLVRAGRHGPGPARNLGIAAAREAIIGFVDADDAWPAGRLRRQMARLAAEPKLDVLGGFVLCCERIDTLTLEPDPAGRIETPMFGPHLGAALFRADLLRRLGGFDESFLYSEDVDLLMKVREQKAGYAIERAVTLYYRRGGNTMMSREDPRKTADFRRAIMQSLIRRRAAGRDAADLPDFAAFVDAPHDDTVSA